jgi:hypothetical protein
MPQRYWGLATSSYCCPRHMRASLRRPSPQEIRPIPLAWKRPLFDCLRARSQDPGRAGRFVRKMPRVQESSATSSATLAPVPSLLTSVSSTCSAPAPGRGPHPGRALVHRRSRTQRNQARGSRPDRTHVDGVPGRRRRDPVRSRVHTPTRHCHRSPALQRQGQATAGPATPPTCAPASSAPSHCSWSVPTKMWPAGAHVPSPSDPPGR